MDRTTKTNEPSFVGWLAYLLDITPKNGYGTSAATPEAEALDIFNPDATPTQKLAQLERGQK